ncbi:hypothetical protein IGK74_001120 [Enterococcus sp. AZ150]
MTSEFIAGMLFGLIVGGLIMAMLFYAVQIMKEF